jgi:hypothetical protein
MQRWLAEFVSVHFDLGVVPDLPAFDDDEIDWRQFLQQFVHARLGCAAQFAHQRVTIDRRNQNLRRTRHAVGMRILARLIDVKAVMGVLERRYLQATRDQSRDDLAQQSCLAGAAPAGDTDNAHGSL